MHGEIGALRNDASSERGNDPRLLGEVRRATVRGRWPNRHRISRPTQLPPKLRARIHALAKQSGRSAHCFILEAVERHADYEEQMRSLITEAIEADAEIARTGEMYRADDVHAWVARLARGPVNDRPKPWRR